MNFARAMGPSNGVGTPPHALWLREVRKLTDSGHQVSLIGTAFEGEHEAEKFNRLLPGRKRLLDAVRMISYRVETAMVPLLMNETVDSSQARTILQTLFVTEADILPDPEHGWLKVRVHRATCPVTDRHCERLFTYGP